MGILVQRVCIRMKVYIIAVVVCLSGLALGKSGECPDRHHHHRHHDRDDTSIYPRPSPQPCTEDDECPSMEKCCEMERDKICVPPKGHHPEGGDEYPPRNRGMHDDDDDDCDDESKEEDDEDDDMSDHSGERKHKKCHRKHGHHKKFIMLGAAGGLILIVIAIVVFVCVRRRNLRKQGHKHGHQNAVCVANDDQKKNMDFNVTPVFTPAMYMTTQPPPYEKLEEEEKKQEIV